jgi:hypothetical protein
MSRPIAFMLLVMLAGPASAQVSNPAEQAVIDANSAIRARNEQIMAENAAAQAAYRQEVARVEAARRANEARFATATAAYEAQQARYAADMAAWRVESARVAEEGRRSAAPPAAKPGKDGDPRDRLICRKITPTGSNLSGKRICRTKAEWARGY